MSSFNFIFTLNNYTEEEVNSLVNLIPDKLRFLAFSKEVGERGTPHLQGYMCHWKKVRLTGMKKLVPRAHFERMNGSLKQNEKYCSKQSQLLKFGDEPKDSGLSEKDRWADAVRLAKQNKIDEILEKYPDIGVRCYNTFKRIKQDYATPPDDLDKIEAYWYYGKTGTGKSRTARRNFPGIYNKSVEDIWWGDYDGTSPVLFDDLSPRNHYMVDQIKRICDHYSVRIQAKGNQFLIRPRVIVVTSNYTMEQIFTDPEDLEPLKRRFKIVNF